MTGKRKVVRYATDERISWILPKNIDLYDKYRKSRISRNRDVETSTYRQYKSSYYIFLCFLAERYENPCITDKEFLTTEFMDMMDDYIFFLQDELGNGLKRCNFHLSAISSFYIYALERRWVEFNPMNNIRRMEGANKEILIDSDFLTQKEVDKIYTELEKSLNPNYKGKFDIIDLIIWSVMFTSTSRLGAVTSLTLSKLKVDEKKNLAYFENIREKRGKITKVVIDMKTYGYIQEFLKWREIKGIEIDALFPAWYNNGWVQMGRNSIYSRVQKIGSIVDLTAFRPHSIRKSAANLLYKEHGIEATQAVLLHESSDTTMKHYIEKQDVDDVFAKIYAKK